MGRAAWVSIVDGAPVGPRGSGSGGAVVVVVRPGRSPVRGKQQRPTRCEKVPGAASHALSYTLTLESDPAVQSDPAVRHRSSWGGGQGPDPPSARQAFGSPCAARWPAGKLFRFIAASNLR